MRPRVFIAGLLGLATGLAAGVLLAPKSGKDLRSDLAKESIKYRKQAEEQWNKLTRRTQRDLKKLDLQIEELSDELQKELNLLSGKSMSFNDEVNAYIRRMNRGEAKAELELLDYIDEIKKSVRKVSRESKKK